MATKPDDPLPWKCRVTRERLAIGNVGSIHSDCCIFKPRKQYRQQGIKKYLRRWYGLPKGARVPGY